MDRLIQGNVTTEYTKYTTASTRGLRLQHESPYSEGPGSSKFTTVAPLTTARYSPDSHCAFSRGNYKGPNALNGSHESLFRMLGGTRKSDVPRRILSSIYQWTGLSRSMMTHLHACRIKTHRNLAPR